MLELFCANLSRRSTHSVLLVRSDLDAPIWISSQECLKLALGECNFTCCETNHLGPRGDSKMKCSRKNVKTVLSRMIDAKANHLSMMKNAVHGRWTRVLKHWWLRDLDENGWVTPFSSCGADNLKKDLKTWLDWDKNIDGTFFDRDGVSLLIYAVCANHFEAVRYLLNEINESCKSNDKERRYYTESCIPKNGVLHFGIPGSCTALIGAMTIASPEIVQLLLENGANPYATDVNGNSPFMCACTYNRVDNVKFWLKQFPMWNLEARNTVVGGFALGCAVYMGPNRLELVKLLLKSGTHINMLTFAGGSSFTAACENEDADPQVIRLLLNHGSDMKYRVRATVLKWKVIRQVAKITVRGFKTSNGLLRYIAKESGATALHYAVMRGDMEIVELLLSEGADPNLKNDLGQNAAAMCKGFPELQRVLEEWEGKTKLQSAAKKKQVLEVPGGKISTVIPVQHEVEKYIHGDIPS